MKNKFTCILIVALLFLVGISIACYVRANHFSANEASIVGGVLSAVATGLLGVVAFWQNKRYKELADEFNERAYMPELYKVNTVGETLHAMSKSAYNSFFYIATEIEETATTIDCGQFMVMNSPILNIGVESLMCAGKSLLFLEQQHSLYATDAAFSLFLKIAPDFVKHQVPIKVTFHYRNMYGAQYTKIATFTLKEGTNIASNWKLLKAKRTA